MIIKCAQCNTPKYCKPCRFHEGRNYCSRRCSIVHSYKTGVRNGSKLTEKAHQTLKEKGHYKRDNSYLIGSSNPAWSGGYTKYRGYNWEKIKIEARERDGHVCVQCSMTERVSLELFGQTLHVDHILPYKISRDSSLSNLQTLCCNCHGKKWATDLKLIKVYIPVVN